MLKRQGIFASVGIIAVFTSNITLLGLNMCDGPNMKGRPRRRPA